MRFAYPLFFLLLLILPFLNKYLSKKRIKGSISHPGISTFKMVIPPDSVRFKNITKLFRYTALVLLILALARPQTGKGEEDIITKGIDIMLILDISGSMSTTDIEPTRIGGAKVVAREFVDKRRNDRIGLVVFAGNSFTQSPLTIDHVMLNDLINSIHIGMTEDGTAIGMAIATAVNRLRESKAESRIIILLTDGVNNRGSIDPKTAADLAKAMGVKIYTIGVGTEGIAYQVIQDPIFGKRKVPVRTKIDEQMLETIAAQTDGKYYRATNTMELKKIYEEIDTLEKVEIKSKHYANYTEQFPYFLYPALLLLGLEIVLSNTLLRRIP